MAKQDKRILHAVWLDLANAYGSVPHELVYRSFDFYIQEKIKGLLRKYFNSAFMHFTIHRYTTNWQALEVGIMMGYVISPLLFIMCVEMPLRGPKDVTEAEVEDGGIVLPAMKAFMDDVTILIECKSGTEHLLQRSSLFTWCRMKTMPKMSRSLSIIHDK